MHSVVFDHAWADWNEALPMGNGVFGGMVRFWDGVWSAALNHYEIYYSILEQYADDHEKKVGSGEAAGICPARTLAEFRDAAERNTRDCERERFLHYRKTIWPQADVVRQAELKRGQSHPMAGGFSLRFDRSFSFSGDHSLRLDIESAVISLQAAENGRSLSVAAKTLQDKDIVLTRVRQSDSEILSGMEISGPARRNRPGDQCMFFCKDRRTFGYHASVQGAGSRGSERFRFCVMYRVTGAEVETETAPDGRTMDVKFVRSSWEVEILTCVVTELAAGVGNRMSPDEMERSGEQALAEAEQSLERLEAEHAEYWDGFFSRARVQLPDRFLERLWFLDLYLLGGSSGRGGRRYEQACGLNGLWDVRQPTLWGSMWYWDVNIQSAFWPVYASDHLELAEAFNDALLSYAGQAEKRAERFYHMPGYAADYPHEFYNCILPWCAQHLWWYYEYTSDRRFLREKAYPFFRELLVFICSLVQYDREKDVYYIFPDVSPEQGPVTRNSVITVASFRYLAEIGIRANEILSEKSEDREMFRRLLEKLPDYPLAETERYGTVLKDSELAPPELWLRHPSLLMPVFPVGEMSRYSAERERKLAENTVRYASEHTERGVFQFGWLASAAARTGQGNLALRILYEQGIDLMLRANGLGAEETDRWMNHCLADSEAGRIFSPFMMECAGGLVSAVNEMLLQDFDGVIHVFPAVPDGSRETWRDRWQQEPLVEREEQTPPENWEDAAFSGMLARGGFVVSAERRKGKTARITLQSRYGGRAEIDIREMETPVRVRKAGKETVCTADMERLTLDTLPGEEYEILSAAAAVPADAPLAEASAAGTEPGTEGEKKDTGQVLRDGISYAGSLGRRVFCGKDRHTDVFKLLDSFLYDSYVADNRCSSYMAGKFSFGVPFSEQESRIIDPAYEPRQKVEKTFAKITPDIRYCPETGIGFGAEAEIEAADGGRMNVLVRDSIRGRAEAEFLIELPKGIYECLALCGDGENAYCTCLQSGGSRVRIRTEAGGYGADVFLVSSSGAGPAAIRIGTEDGLGWDLNLLVVKKLISQL